MIVSIDEEVGFTTIQHSLVMKTLNKLELEGNFLSLVKGIYKTPTANLIRNGESRMFF